MSQIIGELDHFGGPVQLVVRANARRISLKMDHATRAALLVIPHKRNIPQAKKLLAQRSDWLQQQRQSLPPAMPFVDQGTILLRGRNVRLVFQKGRGLATETTEMLVVPATQSAAFSGRVGRALVEIARAELQNRASAHADRLGVTFGRLTVRDTRSRWGSCSASGNLNFSWRLICAPSFVLDYVAAHEVVHLIHGNHGPDFWSAVESIFGSPRDPRKYLAEHAADLFAVGATH